MNAQQIKKKYRRIARFYDLPEGPFGKLRAKAIDRLALRPGQVVLDCGCGTGLSFELLEQALRQQGHIIGVELSPEMLARARKKIAGQRWTNITLIEADAEEADLPSESVDAVLCFYTHDLMNSRCALQRAVNALRPGGRCVAAGGKRAHGLCGVLLNPITLIYSLPFITTLSEITRPWTHLEQLIGQLHVEEALWGTAYIADGIKTGQASPP